MALAFGVNYLAVLVSAIAAFVIGFVYYGLTGFRERWMAMVGKTVAPGARPSPASALVGVVAAFVNAWGLAVIARSVGATTVTDAVVLGVLAWVAFMATLSAATVAMEERPWSLWALHNLHHVIVQVVMAAIVVLWR
jgi:hypothetical protein